ncbi:hypothetical protein [Lentzea albida]|uniref:hypothetical protein n=1 Tax=Lentzea albida TaxID=65499 RepID=UPI001160DEC8|nr:hypothetical protein [Lentzea albida]
MGRTIVISDQAAEKLGVVIFSDRAGTLASTDLAVGRHPFIRLTAPPGLGQQGCAVRFGMTGSTPPRRGLRPARPGRDRCAGAADRAVAAGHGTTKVGHVEKRTMRARLRTGVDPHRPSNVGVPGLVHR